MDKEAMVVAVMGIACGTGVLLSIINMIKTILSDRGKRANEALLAELRELREEVRELRRQNNDIILALDSVPDRRTIGHGNRPITEREQPLHRS